MIDIAHIPLKDATELLFEAVHRQNLGNVTRVLAARPETAMEKIGTASALMLLADVAMPEQLLRNGEDQNKYRASIDIATLLLENGCDINAQGFDQKTPLMRALQRGCLRLSARILGKNPDLSIVGEGNAGVLYTALVSRELDDIDTRDPAETVTGIISTLIDRGAPAHAPDGESVLEYYPNMNTRLFDLLLQKKCGLDIKNKDGVLPAAALADNGRWVAVLKILKTGCQFDAVDKHGRTLDEIARSQNREDMVAKLHEMRLARYLETAERPKTVLVPVRKNLTP